MKRKMMDELLKWKKDKDKKPLILKGVRQVGKTFLLKEFGREHFPNFHYFNFEKQPALSKIFDENFDTQRILSELEFSIGRKIDVKNDLVIFDEIQESPKAVTSLKYFQEDCPGLHLCSAGSLLGLHLSPASFPVGKVTFKTLRPMTFEEFLMATGDKALSSYEAIKIPEIVHEHLWNQLKRYFVVGGLPEVIAAYCEAKEDDFTAFSIVRQKQKDLLNTYYADVAKHSGKINAMHIIRILHAVPAQIQQVQDGSIGRFKFKGVVPGVTHYDRLSGAIDWLEAAGLVSKVRIVNTGHIPFVGYSKENILKLLMFDVGILGSMCELPPKVILDYEYGSYKGYFAENYVGQELLGHGRESLYSWQENRNEVEFLVEEGGEVIPLEVKSGGNIKAKSLQIFAEKYKPSYQVVFSGNPLKMNAGNSVQNYPLYLIGKFPIR